MKKDDDPFIITRNPRATGDANERQILDMIHDSRGLRTIIRRGADGSTVRCRTRAGFVEFVVEDPTQDTSEDDITPLFLETGSTQYPGAQTLLQYNGLSDGQGRWWFKVSVASNWLGYISDAVGTQSDRDNRKLYGKYGGATPPANATLYDGMISPATSLPTVYANNSSWIDAMLTKRKAIVTCPASMFSGKMRLFMQARYGALLSPSQDIQSDDAFGVIVDGLPLSNLGGVGVGIFTTEQKEHFVVKISGSTVNFYKLKPIKAFAGTVKELRAKLSALPAPSQAEQEKLEAYIFAGSYIDTEVYKSYPGVAASCSPAVYGWNFNWGGEKADVISISTAGSGINTYFVSTHYALTISHYVSGNTDNWYFSVSTVSTENWVDGRGAYHIFLPDYADGGRMVLYTLGLGVNQIECSAKIHCFYKKDGELVFARYVRGPTSGPYAHWYENDADYKGSANNQSSSYNTGAVVIGRRKATYYDHASATTGSQAFSVGSGTYGGSYIASSGTTVLEIGHGMGCAAPPQVRPMAEWVVNITAYGCGHPFTGWSGYGPLYANDPYVNKANYFSWTEENLGRMSDAYQQPATRKFHTLVIPFFDCCAVYVYERDATHSGDVAVVRDHETCYNTTYGAHALTNIYYDPPGDGFEAYGDCVGNEFMSGWHTIYSTEGLTKNLGPVLYSLGIHHFHGTATATPTEPDSTLVNFFFVNAGYPYVDLQVWTSVNAGSTTAQLPVYNPDQYRRWTGWV